MKSDAELYYEFAPNPEAGKRYNLKMTVRQLADELVDMVFARWDTTRHPFDLQAKLDFVETWLQPLPTRGRWSNFIRAQLP